LRLKSGRLQYLDETAEVGTMVLEDLRRQRETFKVRTRMRWPA
jgi:hypothetical protein